MLQKAVLTLCLVLCAWAMIVPRAAEAQKPASVYRIGWLTPEAAADPFAASLLDTFKKELRGLGYTEGQNVVIDV